MKLNKLYFLFALGLIGAVYGVSKFQPHTSDLVACCDPETDPDCDPDPDPDPDPDGDSMPTQFVG